MKNTIGQIDEMGLSKKKAETLKENLEQLLTELQSNLPFMAAQFEGHMEATVESAKQEVHGYMTGVLQRAGVEALSNDQLPLAIGRTETTD